MTKEPSPKSQIDKFKDAARELGTDDDPERFKEKVRKLAKAKPLPASGSRTPKRPPRH